MITTIGFIGAGEMGRAMTALCARSGVSVRSWDKDARKCQLYQECSDVVAAADVLLLCVPSRAQREVARQITSLLRRDAFVISVAKGLEPGTYHTVAEILTDELPDHQPVGLLYGPMLAEEIMAGLPAAGVLASSDQQRASELAVLLAPTNLAVQLTDDVPGTALSGVLKNIYAIGLGIAAGLKLGDNFRGWYVQQAAAEMAGLVTEFGGRRESALGLAGLGDLVTTGSSTYSTNFSAGLAIGQDVSSDIVSEGQLSLPLLMARRGDRQVPLLLKALQAVLIANQPPEHVFRPLIRRPA